MPVAGEQAHGRAVALDDQAIAVVLDFVDPLRPLRNLGRTRGLSARFRWSIGGCSTSAVPSGAQDPRAAESGHKLSQRGIRPTIPAPDVPANCEPSPGKSALVSLDAVTHAGSPPGPPLPAVALDARPAA